MDNLKKKYMWSNPQGLKTQNSLTLYTFFSKLSMALSKHLGHGMTLSLNFCLKMVLLEALSFTLKKEPRLYLKPVYTVKADESEELEEIANSKPHIKFKNNKAWFTFQRARGGQVKVTIESLKENNSEAIFRVLSMIKISTRRIC